MALTLARTALASHRTRTAIRSSGGRRYSSSLSSRRGGSSSGGILGKIKSVFSGLVGLVGNAVNKILEFIGFSFSKLAEWICDGVGFIWNFNWNVSDEDLDKAKKAMWDAAGGHLGEIVGKTIGWSVCGLGAAGAIAVFNQPLALYVAKEVGEEAYDEILGSVANFVRASSVSLLKAVVIDSYKNVRKWLKNPSNPFYKTLKKRFGKSLDNWGKPGAKEFSFASWTQEKIESLPDGFIQNFVENAWENFTESCREAFVVVGGSVDNYLAMSALSSRSMTSSILGGTQTVEIDFSGGTTRVRPVTAATPGGSI